MKYGPQQEFLDLMVATYQPEKPFLWYIKGLGRGEWSSTISRNTLQVGEREGFPLILQPAATF